jgi:hypothetical protein
MGWSDAYQLLNKYKDKKRRFKRLFLWSNDLPITEVNLFIVALLDAVIAH